MSRRSMQPRPSSKDRLREDEGGEFFERDPATGEKTDARMHAELLGEDEPGVRIEGTPRRRKRTSRLWDTLRDGDRGETPDGQAPEAPTPRVTEAEGSGHSDTTPRDDGTDTPYVLFLRTTSHGQQPAGRVTVRDGHVVFEGVDPALVEEMRRGIPIGRRRFMPADGDAFLRALRVQYSGSFLRAQYHGSLGRRRSRR